MVHYPANGRRFRIPHFVQHIGKLSILRRPVGVYDIPEGRCLWWRRFGIEGRYIEFPQVRRNVPISFGVIPAEQSVPITVLKVVPGKVAPCNVVAAIFGRQIDAIDPIVGRVNDADNIEDPMRPKELFIYL
jgi:hypothetical protein